MRHLFSNVVSYNCFVEPGDEVAILLALFIKKGFVADVQTSTSLTAPHYGYAGTRESIFIRHSSWIQGICGVHLWEACRWQGLYRKEPVWETVRRWHTANNQVEKQHERGVNVTFRQAPFQDAGPLSEPSMSGSRTLHRWNIPGTEHYFIVNFLSAIAAYSCFPKKPCINVTRTIDTRPALFWIRWTHVIYSIFRSVAIM